jgi:hypothetical protein
LHFEKFALSSENGEGVIYVSAPNAGTNSLHASSQEDDQSRVEINKITAADFCKTHKIQNVHLLKCDAEGHDMEVIRGALPLLVDERISVLQFEYNHRWVYSRSFLRDAFMAIRNLPYKLAMLQPNHVLIFDQWHPELERFFEGNYVLIHSDALGWFPSKLVSFDSFNTMHVVRQ